MKITKTQDYRT